MARRIEASRAFERSTRAPLGDFVDRPRRTRGFSYETLFRVEVEHGYYEPRLCPDFRFRPTRSSARMMKALGLLFKAERTGFSVLFDRLRRDLLLSYLRRQLQGPGSPDSEGDGGVWTRLSFILTLDTPYFLNYTALPIDLDPTARNFFFSNEWAEEGSPGDALLNPKASPPAEELLRVVPPSFPVGIDADVDKVIVRSLSGREVLCVPICFPVLDLEPPDQIRSMDASPASPVCFDKQIYLDLSLLPEDRYEIEWISGDQPVAVEPILYTETHPIAFSFIDLLFTRPRPDVGGVYPVEDLFAASPPGTRIEPTTYRLAFEKRKTYWSYFVVPQPDRRRYHPDQLRIESESGPRSPDPPPYFGRAAEVRLANGALAYNLVSTAPIALQQFTTDRLTLKYKSKVLMRRLPYPSIEQVIPEQETSPLSSSSRTDREVDRETISDIYVYV